MIMSPLCNDKRKRTSPLPRFQFPIAFSKLPKTNAQGLELPKSTQAVALAPDEIEVVEEKKDAAQSDVNDNLFKSVEELELSVRSANCLQNANIRYIYELVQRTEPEMLRTKNFGRKSLNEIKDLLNEMGLGLGMKLDLTPEQIAEKTKELSKQSN